ncbi:MAG: molybdopterin-dependent oxidoreductase [Asgard group archaeon]|nr:molybdopterin-dependent oxidoreductase [Asgard group archaeon]
MNKIPKIIVISIIVIVISTGTGIGIWLGIRNLSLGPHPDEDWSLQISGNIIGGDFNITIAELLEMPIHKEKYTIRGSTTFKAIYQGVSISYLIQNIIDINTSATTISFEAIDEFSIHFNITEIIADESNILAYAMDNQYLTNSTEGGTGYLRLIIPPANDSDYNGPLCLKWVAKIIIS